MMDDFVRKRSFADNHAVWPTNHLFQQDDGYVFRRHWDNDKIERSVKMSAEEMTHLKRE